MKSFFPMQIILAWYVKAISFWYCRFSLSHIHMVRASVMLNYMMVIQELEYPMDSSRKDKKKMVDTCSTHVFNHSIWIWFSCEYYMCCIQFHTLFRAGKTKMLLGNMPGIILFQEHWFGKCQKASHNSQSSITTPLRSKNRRLFSSSMTNFA